MKHDWEYKKLGEVCLIERGGSPRPITAFITDAEDGVNWIKIGDAEEGSKYINSTKEKIKPEGVKKSRFVHKGDFILSNSMSFGKPYILGIDGCIHDGWLVIHDADNVFNKDYLYYVLGSANMYAKFKSLAVGGVVNNLNSELVRKVSVPLPPLSTQQSIVSELDSLSKIIADCKETLKDYDALEQSIFYDMFGDPVKNDKGWEVKKLEDATADDCPISYGIVQPGDGETSGIPVVRPVDLTDTYVYPDKLKLTTQEISNQYKRTILKGNEILMCVRGTTGIVSIASAKLAGCNVTRGIVPLSFDEKADEFFMFFQFRTHSIKYLIEEKTYGATLKQINMKDLRELPVILPPLPLQQQFASKIEAIEKMKSETKKALQEAETLFQARMDYWFN